MSPRKTTRAITASLKMMSGKKGTPPSFCRLYFSRYSFFSSGFMGYSPRFGAALIPIRITRYMWKAIRSSRLAGSTQIWIP